MEPCADLGAQGGTWMKVVTVLSDWERRELARIEETLQWQDAALGARLSHASRGRSPLRRQGAVLARWVGALALWMLGLLALLAGMAATELPWWF